MLNHPARLRPNRLRYRYPRRPTEGPVSHKSTDEHPHEAGEQPARHRGSLHRRLHANPALSLTTKLVVTTVGTLVLLSDGMDVSSFLDMEQVLWRARRRQGMVYWLRLVLSSISSMEPISRCEKPSLAYKFSTVR